MRWSVGHFGFQGMRLRRDSRYTGLPKSVVDANLVHGDLRPFPCPEPVCDLQNPAAVVQTILDETDCDCLTFSEVMCFAKNCGLYFWNDETGAPLISTQAEFCLGDGCPYDIACPTTPPNIASIQGSSGSSSTADCDSHYFAYRYSYIITINGQEFEGHWSPPTNAVLADATPATVLNGIPNPGGCHTAVRIYRAASGYHSGESATSQEAGGWFVVGTFPLGGPFVDNDSYLTLQRTAPISPDEFSGPPQDIRSLGCADNGIIFGLKGQDLLYTLPCYPMSWSNKRRICIPEKAGTPIKVVARGDDLYVFTDKYPVLLRSVTGSDSIGFDLTIIQKLLPLASVGSITTGYIGEYFASDDGYYVWEGTEVRNLTKGWFGKEEWCRMDYQSISGVVVEDRLIWSTSVDAFMFYFGDRLSKFQVSSQREQNEFLIGLDLGGLMPGATAHMLTCENKLRFHKDGIVYEWDLCRDIVAEHHKNDVISHVPCCPWVYCDVVDLDRCGNMSRGEVRFDVRTLQNGINLSVFMVKCGERELLKELVVTDCSPFTLPACHNSEEYCIEATGCEHVKDFTFACSLKQLIDEPLPRENVSRPARDLR